MRDLTHNEISEISGGLTDTQFSYVVTMATQEIFKIGLQYMVNKNIATAVFSSVPLYVMTPAVTLMGYVLGSEISNLLNPSQGNVSSPNAK